MPEVVGMTRLCRFCSEFELLHPQDDRCLGCAFFGVGDPHGIRYFAEQRRRENPDQGQFPEDDPVDRLRRAWKERR
jgi:hypothetical protein